MGIGIRQFLEDNPKAKNFFHIKPHMWKHLFTQCNESTVLPEKKENVIKILEDIKLGGEAEPGSSDCA